MKISPVIIAKDASKTIGQTLESLKSFDEVIVYDTGSIDDTIEIAGKYKNVKIHEGSFTGFGETKNKAAQLAKNDWILSIDADEVVGPVLLDSMQNLQPDELAVYRFKRFNYYRNRRIRYSGWGNEFVTRIYNKTKMGFNDKLVHENIESGDANIVTLEGELMHFSYHSISDFIRKRDLYSELFALENAGKRKSSPFMAFVRGTFDFLNTYLIKTAFLDGYRGLLIAVSNSNVSFYKYLKLYEANICNNKKIALIINSIDKKTGLKQTLKSVLSQTVPPSEIILTYDSLNEDLCETINEFEKHSFIPIVRVEQEDKKINSTVDINSLLSKINSDYLVFVDAEIILHKNFILAHSKYSKKGFYLHGSTILLSKKLSEKVVEENTKKSFLFSFMHFKDKMNSLSFSILSYLFQGKNSKNYKCLKSGNFSFFKEDLLLGNKQIQSFDCCGHEFDGLINIINVLGLKKRKLKFVGLQYKLSRTNKNSNSTKPYKALICLDRLKYLNCGLGQVSLNLGRKLLENKLPNTEYSFLLPAKGFEEFDTKVDSIKLTTFRNFFPTFMENYDLCHVTHQLPQYNFGSAKKNILTIHDLNFIYTKSKRKGQKYLQKLQQNIYKSDAIVFISEFTKQTCYEYLEIPKDKIVRIIYNGVEPPSMEFEKPKWLKHDKFLFSIGQFLEKKNFHVLIPFIKILPEDTYLVIAGENNTNYGQKMRHLIAQNNLEHRVFIPGGISESHKNYLYHNCLAYVFPSIAEGFGLPVIEAMLCNKPVFCSNRTSLKEIGGGFAFFWENFDPEYMLNVYNKGLETFITNEYAEKQIAYASTFSHEKNIHEYTNLYQELIESI